jgi:hypothetical protein
MELCGNIPHYTWPSRENIRTFSVLSSLDFIYFISLFRVAVSSPPAITVKAAAAEQQNKHENDQYEFHHFLLNINSYVVSE